MTDKDDVYDSFDEPVPQADIARILGVSRAVVRGYLDRGILQPVDHGGLKGSARVRRGDVLRLRDTPSLAGSVPAARDASPSAEQCARCSRLERELRRMEEDYARLRGALDGALNLR